LIQLNRVTGGRRKVTSVAEVVGMEGDVICLSELFRFQQMGVDGDGHAVGRFEACGVRPRLLDRLKAEGKQMPENLFQHRVLIDTTTEGRR